MFDETTDAECTVAGVEQCIALSITDGKKTLVVHVFQNMNKDELSQLITQNFNNKNVELNVNIIGGSFQYVNDFVYKDGEIIKLHGADNPQRAEDINDIKHQNIKFETDPPINFSQIQVQETELMGITGLATRETFKPIVEERINAGKPLLAFNENNYRAYSIPINDISQNMLFYNSEKIKSILTEITQKTGTKFKLQSDLIIPEEKNVVFDIKNGQIVDVNEERGAFNSHLLRKQIARKSSIRGDTPPLVRKYMSNWNDEKIARKQLEKQGEDTF